MGQADRFPNSLERGGTDLGNQPRASGSTQFGEIDSIFLSNKNIFFLKTSALIH